MYDVIVAGGGPAGLTAALYAARSGCRVLVLEKAVAGGQIVYSPLVENYPGMSAVSGEDFTRGLVEQVEALGVELEFAAFQGFHAVPGGGWAAESEDGERVCRALVLALGADHRHLGLAGEEELVGRGVSYCAVCDGPFFRGSDVAVVGGGDTALQDALYLSNVCRSVTLIHRREQFRGEAGNVRRVQERENIKLMLGWRPEALLQKDGELTGLRLSRTDGSGETELSVAGVFIAVGQQPGTAPAAKLLELDQGGYFPTGEDCAAALPGVFVAGDCRAKAVRQLTTAVSDGAVAGLAAAKYAEAHAGR